MSKLLPFSRAALTPAVVYSHSITISGESGTGKGELVRVLRRRVNGSGLPFRFLSVGTDIFRPAARLQGMTIEQFVRHCREHPELGDDHRCDQRVVEYGLTNFLVAEGRGLHFLIPAAYHVQLTCPPHERAKRRFATDGGDSVDAVERSLRQRDKDDWERYELMYPGCHWDVFDDAFSSLVDSAETLADKILAGHQVWLAEQARRGVTVVNTESSGSQLLIPPGFQST